MVSKASRRYAKALLATAIEQDNMEGVYEDILFLNNTLKESSELRAFLKSPVIKPEIKKSALDEIFKKHIQDLTSSLIDVLASKGREGHLQQITEGFLALYNEYHNILEVDVKTAFEFVNGQEDDLRKELEKMTGKSVRMSVAKQENLIGGLTVRIADTVYDGSAKYKLNQLKDKFTAAVE